MPLQPQVIDIDMGLGLDTFTDPKSVVPGKFTTLENVRFVRGKRLEMRRGNVAYGGTYKIGNTGSASDSFGSFSNRLHVKRTETLNDLPVFYCEYQKAAGSAQDSGQRYPATYRDQQTALSRLTENATNAGYPHAALVNTCRVQSIKPLGNVLFADSCVVGTYTVHTWSQGTAANHAVFAEIKGAHGSTIHGPINYTGSSSWSVGGGWVMCLPVSATRAWLFNNGGSTTSFQLLILDVTNPNWSNTRYYTAASSGGTGGTKIDAVVMGSDVFVVGHDLDGGTGVVIKSAPTSSTTPTVGLFTAKNSYALGGATLYSVAFAKPKSGATKLRAFWKDGTNGLRGVSITASTGATVTGPTTINASAAAVYQLSAVELGEDYLWIGHTLTAGTSTIVYRSRETGTFAAATSFLVPGTLATRLVDRSSTDTASFWCRSSNANYTEAAYYQYQIQNSTIVVSAKQMSGRSFVSSAFLTTFGVANITPITADLDYCVLTDAFALVRTSAAAITADIGFASITTNYDPRAMWNCASTGKSLVMAGGIVGHWEGRNLSHVGALMRPTIASVSTSAAGGAMSNGTYSIVTVPTWLDAAGQRHWGAPSDPFPVTLSGGGAAQQFTVTDNYQSIPHVGSNPSTVSSATSAGQLLGVTTIVFSTTNGGTIYRRATEASSGVTRTCSDTDLLTREVLYTTGGVLPNALPDGPPVVGSFNDRVLFSSPSEDGILYAQKPPYLGYGPEFSDQLTVGINSEGGPVTAIVENVDRCCVFKKRSIQVFTGEGYTATGEGGYSNAETIYEHLGCPGPWAATSTPVGVMFDTGGQGIWLLGRDLQLSYIGEGVDSWKDTDVYSVSVVPNEQEVRWLMASGEILSYNWTAAAWSVSTPFSCWDIGLANGVPIYLRKSTSNLGGVYIDSDTAFTDMMAGVIDVSAATITMQAITGWMNFAGLQGYQRVWRALFTGDYSDVHNLLVDVGYDYKPTYADSFSLASANIMAGSSVYDGQVTLHQSFSKAVRLKLRASSSAGDVTGPMSLTGLSFEVGILPRGARMPSSKGA